MLNNNYKKSTLHLYFLCVVFLLFNALMVQNPFFFIRRPCSVKDKKLYYNSFHDDKNCLKSHEASSACYYSASANIKHLPCWSNQCRRWREWKRWASCYNCSSDQNRSSQYRGPPKRRRYQHSSGGHQSRPVLCDRRSVNRLSLFQSYFLPFNENIL